MDLTPVVLQVEGGQGHTKDLSAECWKANNGGRGSARFFRLQQTQRRKRGGMEVQLFGICGVEVVMSRKYMQVTQKFFKYS